MSEKIAARIIGGLLALVLLLALGAVRSSWTKDEAVGVQAEKQTAQRVDKKKTKSSLSPESGEQAPSPDGQAADKKGEASEDASEFWPSLFGFRFKITDSLLVLFTAVLAWKTSSLDNATRKLWEAGERQIKQTAIAADAARRSADYAQHALTNGQRAWITIDAKINQTVSFDMMGIQVPVEIEMVNIGNSIALNTTPFAHIFFDKKHEPRVEAWQKFIADSVRQPGYFSIFLPPAKSAGKDSEKKTLTIMVSTSPFDSATKEIDMREPIRFFIGGCVTYTFPSDRTKMHHTGFFFHVRRKDGKPILIGDGPIDSSDLVMTRDLGTNFFSID